MNLESLGWNRYWQAQWQEVSDEQWIPARVVAQRRALYRIAGEFGECWGEVAGRLRYEADSGADYPVTGDWVAADVRGGDARATIQGILLRRTRFSRQAAGRQTAEQVIAANMDTVFVMTSLNHDFNLRRLERYLALVWESGAAPVVLLAKADLCSDARAFAKQAERAALGANVHVVSAATGEGVDEVLGYFREGVTIALLGSSGVGKSTLVNRLMGMPVQAIREIREGDDRGRHTTTTRELFRLPQGGLVLDTPGMRELQVWNAAEGLQQAFSEIADLALQCRFRDCTHESERGCAVQQALADGSLDAGRLESLRKLEREQEFQARKIDGALRRAERDRWKQIHRDQRAKYELRRKEGRDKHS